MRRNILNSPRLLELKKGRRKVIFKKILLSFLALFIIFASLVYLSRLEQINITEIKISGNKSIDADTIKSVTQQEITGNYLWFIPKTNFLLYPKSIIKAKLQDEFFLFSHKLNIPLFKKFFK